MSREERVERVLAVAREVASKASLAGSLGNLRTALRDLDEKVEWRDGDYQFVAASHGAVQLHGPGDQMIGLVVPEDVRQQVAELWGPAPHDDRYIVGRRQDRTLVVRRLGGEGGWYELHDLMESADASTGERPEPTTGLTRTEAIATLAALQFTASRVLDGVTDDERASMDKLAAYIGPCTDADQHAPNVWEREAGERDASPPEPKLNEAQEQVTSLNAEIERLKRELSKLSAAQGETQTQREAARVQRDKARAEVKRLERRVEQFREELGEAHNELTRADVPVEKYGCGKFTLAARVQWLAGSRADTLKELTEARNEDERLQTALAAAKAHKQRIGEVAEERDAAREEVERLKARELDDFTVTGDELERAHRERDDALFDANQHRQRADTILKTLRDVTRHRNKAYQERDDARAEIGRLEDIVADLSLPVDDYRPGVKTWQERAERAEALNIDLKERNLRLGDLIERDGMASSPLVMEARNTAKWLSNYARDPDVRERAPAWLTQAMSNMSTRLYGVIGEIDKAAVEREETKARRAEAEIERLAKISWQERVPDDEPGWLQRSFQRAKRSIAERPAHLRPRSWREEGRGDD